MTATTRTAPFVMITTHRVAADRLDELESLTHAYLDHVDANEPWARVHSAYVDPDRAELSLVQVHPDAEAADRHMQVAHEILGQALDLVENVGIEVYGEPGPVLRQALDRNRSAGVPVTVRSTVWGGFLRSGDGGS